MRVTLTTVVVVPDSAGVLEGKQLELFKARLAQTLCNEVQSNLEYEGYSVVSVTAEVTP